MSYKIQNKKKNKKQSQKNSKTKKNISARTRRYSNKNNANKCKSMVGGASLMAELKAKIKSKLKNDNEPIPLAATGIASNGASASAERQKNPVPPRPPKLSSGTSRISSNSASSLMAELEQKLLSVGTANATRPKPPIAPKPSRFSSNGAAAVARVVHHEPDAMPVFTIITTGLSNAGSDNNVIVFYGIIMESLIPHTFFGKKIRQIQVHHYDMYFSNESPKQKAQYNLIRETEEKITNQYSIPLTSKIYKKNLDPHDETLQLMSGLDTRNCFHLDFANLDEGKPMITDSFLSIGRQPIKKLYFGYWEPTYPSEYADIIKGIKLIEINPDKSITTFADKMRALGVSRPRLFYSIPECEGISRQVITIPGIRTMYQWGGLDAIELYKSLWHSSPEGMKKYITDYQKSLVQTAFDTLKRIKANETRTVFCEFCPVRQCLKTEFPLNDYRPHPRLCGLCYRLTLDTIERIERIEQEMIKNTPPVSV